MLACLVAPPATSLQASAPRSGPFSKVRVLSIKGVGATTTSGPPRGRRANKLCNRSGRPPSKANCLGSSLPKRAPLPPLNNITGGERPMLFQWQMFQPGVSGFLTPAKKAARASRSHGISAVEPSDKTYNASAGGANTPMNKHHHHSQSGNSSNPASCAARPQSRGRSGPLSVLFHP